MLPGGGLVEPSGLSLIAGAGSVGWGRNKQGRTHIYTDPDVRRNFASLSKMVMQTAQQGDQVAIEVAKEGAPQIAHFLATCAEVLDMQDDPYKVADTGGMVSSGGWYFDLIQENLRAKHPQATLVKPKFDPVVGAALIALAEIAVEWDETVVKNLEKSLKR